MSSATTGARCTVRAATQDDVDAVAAIEEASFAFPWTRGGFRAELFKPGVCFLVACAGATVVGYLCGQILDAETACINNIAVHPDRRRSGVGTLLLRTALDAWRNAGIRRVCLDVRTSNTPAIRLYQAHGFTASGVRASFYPDGADALVMTAELTEHPGTHPGISTQSTKERRTP